MSASQGSLRAALHGMGALSREGRDTLWLLLFLGLSMAPHLPRLPLWCSLGAGAALAWRAWLAWRDGPLPRRWLLFTALIASVALTASTHQTVLGREAGITLVTVLASLKTLELRARRDAFVVTALGFFMALTQFIYSQSPLTAALMLVTTWGLLTSLVLAQRPLGRPGLGAVGRATARTMLMGLPVMLVLYVLFPRIGPLWSVPTLQGARTGLSDRLELGQVSELALDDRIAMRVRFEGAAPPPQALYFRGPVLGEFNGRTWLPQRPGQRAGEATDARWLPRAGLPAVRYQATLEPQTVASLPLLDGTVAAQPAPPFSEPRPQLRGRDWYLAQPSRERAVIDAIAYPGVSQGPDGENAISLRDWLQLPPGYNPRTLDWAARQRQLPALREADPRATVRNLLTHIRTAGFRYTLTPGDAQSPTLHAIDRFWLDTRAGFCEHFATAFVVILRAMDVPARVVTGFQGAEINPVDGLHVVRNSDAHAWAEFWQPGEGWVRVDPTAAVAPDRVERTRPAVRFPDAGGAGLVGNVSPLWRSMRAYLDAGNHRWNLWVLSYSRQRQMDLLRDLGLSSPDTSDLIRLTAIAASAAALVGAALLWWARPRVRRVSVWQRPLARLHAALLATGAPAPANCPAPAPAATWYAHLRKAPPGGPGWTQHGDAILAELQALDALRYGVATHSARQATQAVAAIERLCRQCEQANRARTGARASDGVQPTGR